MLPDALNWSNWLNAVKSVGLHAWLADQGNQSLGFSMARLVSMPVAFESTEDWASSSKGHFDSFLGQQKI